MCSFTPNFSLIGTYSYPSAAKNRRQIAILTKFWTSGAPVSTWALRRSGQNLTCESKPMACSSVSKFSLLGIFCRHCRAKKSQNRKVDHFFNSEGSFLADQSQIWPARMNFWCGILHQISARSIYSFAPTGLKTATKPQIYQILTFQGFCTRSSLPIRSKFGLR